MYPTYVRPSGLGLVFQMPKSRFDSERACYDRKKSGYGKIGRCLVLVSKLDFISQVTQVQFLLPPFNVEFEVRVLVPSRSGEAIGRLIRVMILSMQVRFLPPLLCLILESLKILTNVEQ